jgi:hypothetical protein
MDGIATATGVRCVFIGTYRAWAMFPATARTVIGTDTAIGTVTRTDMVIIIGGIASMAGGATTSSRIGLALGG